MKHYLLAALLFIGACAGHPVKKEPEVKPIAKFNEQLVVVQKKAEDCKKQMDNEQGYINKLRAERDQALFERDVLAQKIKKYLDNKNCRCIHRGALR